eukprot:TRINITY_DN1551_c0_g1_i2.p2 TRINITY_DN1551_c0_g1~~TRINITY_DN1551_c0_g1_i2.p2  ORF type:complete len:173 (+),score=44.31 TRINITY_DN1551_c0_g1_i2:770-1288(+)
MAKFLASFAVEPAGAEGKAQQTESEDEGGVTRVLGPDDWRHGCTERKRVCLVAVLDQYNFPDDTERYEAVLEGLAEKYKGRLAVSWFGAPEQPSAIAAFDLRSGFPAVVAINTGKLVYSRHVGSFTTEALEEFANAVLMGSWRHAGKLSALPDLRDVDPKDFEPPPMMAEEL